MNASMKASLRYRSVMKGPFKISISYEFITKNQITKLREKVKVVELKVPLIHCMGSTVQENQSMQALQ